MAARREEYFWVALGALGDALMLISMADEALAASPVADRATLLAVRNRVLLRDLSEDNDRIYVRPFSFWPVLSAVARGRRCRVCFAPTFGRLPVWVKLLAWFLARVPSVRVVGFRDQGRWQPYDTSIDFDSRIGVLENLLALAAIAGIPAERTVPHPVFHAIEMRAQKPYLFIHPFAASLKRTLPPHRWRTLIEKLHERYPDYAILVSGSGAEKELAQEWFGHLSYVQPVLDRPIRDIAGYLTGCRLFIGVDTGVTHVAGVFHVPSVVLENNSNPMWFPTYNPNARILINSARCTCTGDKGGDCIVMEEGKPYYRCLYDISEDEILEAIDEMLTAQADGVSPGS